MTQQDMAGKTFPRLNVRDPFDEGPSINGPLTLAFYARAWSPRAWPPYEGGYRRVVHTGDSERVGRRLERRRRERSLLLVE